MGFIDVVVSVHVCVADTVWLSGQRCVCATWLWEEVLELILLSTIRRYGGLSFSY